MTTIRLRYAMVETGDYGCTTFFADGTSYGATPHPWDHHYSVIAHRTGYVDAHWRYCVEHELAHLTVEEFLFNRPSRILWGLAHDAPLSPAESVYEEALAQMLQRFARASERPIIGGVDWDALRDRFLGYAGQIQ